MLNLRTENSSEKKTTLVRNIAQVISFEHFHTLDSSGLDKISSLKDIKLWDGNLDIFQNAFTFE